MKNKIPWLILILILFVAAVTTVTYRGYFIGNGGGLTNVFNVYPVEFFGAKGDGDVANSCSTTSGSKTLTSTQSHFTALDIGKIIMVYGTNVGTPCFTTTIDAVGSASSITLHDNSPQTLSTAQAVYFTDDQPALQLAAYAMTNVPSISVYFTPGKIYGCYATQTVSGVVCHINIPFLSASPTNQKATLRWFSDANYGGNWVASPDANNMFRGLGGMPIIWSALPRGRDGAVPDRFVFSGESNFSYDNVVMQYLDFRGAYDNNMVMLDLFRVWGIQLSTVKVDSGYAQGAVPYWPLTGTNGLRFRLPQGFNDNEVKLDNCWALDGYAGIQVNGNDCIDRGKIFTCVDALTCGSTGAGANRFVSTIVAECSNVWHLATGNTVQVDGELHIMNFVVCTNQGDVKFLNTDGGALVGSMNIDVANPHGNPDDTLISNLITNWVSFVGFDLVQHRGTLPAYHFASLQTGKNVNASGDISAAGVLYGDTASIRLSNILLGDNGALVPSSSYAIGANSVYGYHMGSAAWQRFRYQGFCTTNNAGWTNRLFENFTVQICMTNNGVIPIQFGYDTFSSGAHLNGRTVTLYVTNNTGSAGIFTQTWQDNLTIIPTVSHIEPFFLWWGNAGGGNPFNATNNACLLDFSVSFSKSADQTF